MSDPGAGPKWIKLNPVQAVKTYDSVRDTFSKIGVPTEEQGKAYIAMLTSKASLTAKSLLLPDIDQVEATFGQPNT